MCMEYAIKIRDTTTPHDLDCMFKHAWSYKKPVRFVMDVTECRKVIVPTRVNILITPLSM